jgi:integrase
MATQRLSKTDARYWIKRLFKEVSTNQHGNSYERADYSVRISKGGLQKRFQLRTASQHQAAAKARDIYIFLVANGWSATLQKFKTKEPVNRSSAATIGTFLMELRSLHPTKVRTIDDYARSLRKIAADIAGIPSGGRGGKPENHQIWRDKVETVKLAILTDSAVQQWKNNFLAQAGGNPLKERSARTSVNSFLREARSLFTPRYVEKLSAIILPDSLPFKNVKLERRLSARYQSSFDAVALVKDACAELGPEEPEQFKIIVLALGAGLRRNEIDKLEWTRFNWPASKIRIEPTKYFRPKSENSIRTISLPPETLAIFRGYRARALSPFVIESHVKPTMDKSYDHYRCSTLFGKVNAWLKSKGVTNWNALHTMRKEFGSQIAAEFGLFAAQRTLGHADITTTARHYLEEKNEPMVRLGPLDVPNIIPIDPKASQAP